MNKPIYRYNNYFFKLGTVLKKNPLIKNEYNIYKKIKENTELNKTLGNINKYYGCYDREINNKKYKFIISKNLKKDGFMNLSYYLEKNKNMKDK
ncbi:hypothetical protein [Candidatus Ruminimicrobium bovinum]|uniref:hypothetical protein n=1 Tax=Candidatus Ruminimicrobium bovinum TaxID=3242779 RepID=UPI0039B822FD